MPNPGNAPCKYCGRPQPEMAAYIRELQERLNTSEALRLQAIRDCNEADQKAIELGATVYELNKHVADLTAELAEARAEIERLKAHAKAVADEAMEVVREMEARHPVIEVSEAL